MAWAAASWFGFAGWMPALQGTESRGSKEQRTHLPFRSTVLPGGGFREEMWPAGMPPGHEAKVPAHWLQSTSISNSSVAVPVNLPGSPRWGLFAGHFQGRSLGCYQWRTTTLSIGEIWPSSPGRPRSTTIHSLCVTYADWIKHYFKHPHLWGTKITPSAIPFQHESHPHTEQCSFLC